MLKRIKRYFTLKRLEREFKKTHYQKYTIHQYKDKVWMTIDWVAMN